MSIVYRILNKKLRSLFVIVYVKCKFKVFVYNIGKGIEGFIKLGLLFYIRLNGSEFGFSYRKFDVELLGNFFFNFAFLFFDRFYYFYAFWVNLFIF